MQEAGANIARGVQATQDTAASEAVFISGSGRGNIFSNSFDAASCIFSSLIGGAGCRNPAAGQDITNTGYNYKYSSNTDGSYMIIITPDDENKQECTYNSVSIGDDRIETVVDAAAVRCLS
jgi:hypothetical protein